MTTSLSNNHEFGCLPGVIPTRPFWPPTLKFRSNFAHAVRVAQDMVALEQNAFELGRILNWMNAEMQREILRLLLSCDNVSDDAFYQDAHMGKAFRVYIGKAQPEADRKARMSTVVHVTYIDSGVIR